MEILSVKKAKELTIDTEVKPCPFCGETEDMAGIDRGYDQTPHGLIGVWNRRK